MSAPRTNVETQERRHRGPLVGMIAVVSFALILLFFLMADTANNGTPTDNNAPETDGRTGAQVEQIPDDPTTPPADVPVIPEADPPTIPDGDLPPADPATPSPDLPPDPLPDDGAPAP